MRNDAVRLGPIVAAFVLGAVCSAGAMAEGKPDQKSIEVTAATIHKEFTANAEVAATKYRDKIVQVSGLSGGQTRIEVFYLKEKKDTDVIVSLSYFDAPEGEKAKLMEIKPNTKVVVLGKFKSFPAGKVEFSDARLVRIEK